MQTNIFIPEKIKVGFNHNSGTYTKKLGYVIYWDNRGKLRKETSWESWRDKKIEPLDLDNKPMSGFVLNKKAGGESNHWNVRQTYTRVFDPRGFEFEITIPNLLYILQNTDCLKGKGLEGEFVYGWDGTELLLIPTCAPEYKKIDEYSAKIKSNKTIKSKELISGATYLTKANEKLIYLGRFEEWDGYWETNYYSKDSYKSLGKKYFFYRSDDGYHRIITRSGLAALIECVDETPVDNYAELMEELERQPFYSPLDLAADRFEPAKELKQDTRYYFTYKDVMFTFNQNSYYKNDFNNGIERHIIDRQKKKFWLEIMVWASC